MIREVTENDWPHVYGILSHSIQTACANLSWKPQEYEEFAKENKAIAQKMPYLIAEHEGEVIGFGCLHPWLAKDAYWMNLELTLYFRPGCHYGLAKEMLAELEKRAMECGYSRLISCITADNPESIAFHEKNGFTYFGRLENAGWKDGWHGVVWMSKDLETENFDPAKPADPGRK